MIHRFKSWMAEKRAKQKNQSKEEYPEPGPDLPFFLNTKKHLLPISSAKVQPQDALIFKLPSDIRHEILIQAFGARRIHMDLFYHYPYISKPGDSGLPMGAHCDGGYDKMRRKRWQWRGRVCHRTPSPERQKLNDDLYQVWPTNNRSCDPYSPYPSWELGDERNRLLNSGEPGDDTCLRGYARQCGSYTDGGDRSACWIGAIGWIMACRQAYIEGVGVLYGTNTIHISSKALLTRLPADIPTPPRLLFLQSLEIVWNLETVQLPQSWYSSHPIRKGIGQVQLKQILLIILDSLFHIRRLHLALVLRRAVCFELYLDNTVYLLDTFAEGLCRCKHLKVPLQVSITSSVYQQLYKKAKEEAVNKDVVESHVEFQFWRYVDGTCALAPDAPEEFCKINGATVENGYWIVRGDKDGERARGGQLSEF